MEAQTQSEAHLEFNLRRPKLVSSHETEAGLLMSSHMSGKLTFSIAFCNTQDNKPGKCVTLTHPDVGRYEEWQQASRGRERLGNSAGVFQDYFVFSGNSQLY